VVITGVPSKSFEKVRPDEIREGATCINFSTLRNFAKGVKAKSGQYVKRVGPVTVTMCLRNTLRLYRNFHSADAVS
jgi:methylenetetrahydrofolate dehydrogenase (NADP+)/methenyltetrahydrofolate cyclohydrolase